MLPATARGRGLSERAWWDVTGASHFGTPWDQNRQRRGHRGANGVLSGGGGGPVTQKYKKHREAQKSGFHVIFPMKLTKKYQKKTCVFPRKAQGKKNFGSTGVLSPASPGWGGGKGGRGVGSPTTPAVINTAAHLILCGQTIRRLALHIDSKGWVARVLGQSNNWPGEHPRETQYSCRGRAQGSPVENEESGSLRKRSQAGFLGTLLPPTHIP